MDNKRRRIFIVNGFPRAGKDTVAEYTASVVKVPCVLHSTVDTVKEIYRICGWDGEKRAEDRKRLSDLKDFLGNRFDLPYKEVCAKIAEALETGGYLFVMIREPAEIRKVKTFFPFVQTVYVDAEMRRPPTELSNHADAQVKEYAYDIYLDNNGSMEDFEEEIKKKIILKEDLK